MTTAGDETMDDAILLPTWVLERLHAIMGTLEHTGGHKSCMGAFIEIRSTGTLVSLQTLKLDYLENWSPEAIDQIDWDELQLMIARWCQHIEVAVKVLYASERKLVRQVLGHLGNQDIWKICFTQIGSTGMIHFLQFGEGVVRSERAPEKLCKLLDMFETLEKCVTTVNSIFESEGPGFGLQSRFRELQQLVVSGACETFWEFKQMVEQNKGPLRQDGVVMRLNSYVVNYLTFLVSSYSLVMDKVLKIADHWQFEEEEEEQLGLAHGVLLFMQALELQVEQRSEEFPDPALRHLFMMNNLYYICKRSRQYELGPLLGATWLTEQQHKVQQHVLAYEREVCDHMLQQLHLSEAMMARGSSVGGRGSSLTHELLRQRLRGFTAALEEAYAKQAHWIVQEDDLREQTTQALVDAVVPAYKSFLEICGHPINSRGAAGPKGLNLKYVPHEVEKMLNGLLMDTQTHSAHHSKSASSDSGSAYAQHATPK